MRPSTALLALLLPACASSYTPSPDRPFEALDREFRSTNRVTVRNAQPANEEVRMTRWYVNPHAWTEVAITICKRELETRGMAVADGEPRVLELSIESASTVNKAFGFEAESNVVMSVTAGDGYRATYTGWNRAYGGFSNPERQVDGALMRVVREMLNDPRIVKYLTE